MLEKPASACRVKHRRRHLFKRKIRQVPHPGSLRWVRTFLYADPVQAAAVVDAALQWSSGRIFAPRSFLARKARFWSASPFASLASFRTRARADR
jgi:hypothetical protein